MRFWNNISLSKRIYFLLCALVLVTSAGGGVLIWYTYRIDERLTQIIDKNIAAYQAAEGLETALINQKGFVSYYLLDSDPNWLQRLGVFRQRFKGRLHTAQSMAENDRQRESLNAISDKYTRYLTVQDRVISYYKLGESPSGSDLHPESRQLFFSILELCEKYKATHMARISEAKKSAHRQAHRLRIIALTAVLCDGLLGILLAVLLTRHIIVPVRKLTMEAERQEGRRQSGDEIGALQQSVRGLIEDIDESQSQLAKSREHLLQSEKMAMVGKLAAGMAHGIRNPFTSVKMRLFSLSRTLDLSETQKEDFDVVSDEIRHIDIILQNFLEFSRPPRLAVRTISPSEIVDVVLQLLVHRLKSYKVSVEVIRNQSLPEIDADPEQLKEAMVNLIVNACESMDNGGHITISEETAMDDFVGKAVIIRIGDTGPGIPDHLKNKIFQPFFTTKEEGTGLGLSIVERIVRGHQGRVDLFSEAGRKTVFSMIFPRKE